MVALDPRNKRATARPVTTFIGASGQEHEVPNPEFWPDAAQEAFASGEMSNIYQGLRLVVGDAAYEDFVAAGGTGLMLMNHIQDGAGDQGGPVPLGESSGSDALSTVSGAES